MKIEVVTLFPKMFVGPFDESIIKRAREKGLVEIVIHDIRKWAKDRHKSVDDRPYGGGVGMILKVEPVYEALKELKSKNSKIILLTPQGKTFNQTLARKLSKFQHLILIAGHYEGYDERIRKHLVDEEISIGDYVLTGGELPAMVLVDAVARLVPKVLVKPEALRHESFNQNQGLDYPQFTRPEKFQGWRVPKVLLSGNHKEIEKWRKKESFKTTKKNRPDLIK